MGRCMCYRTRVEVHTTQDACGGTQDMCGGAQDTCGGVHATGHVWKSEDHSPESVLSFLPCVGSEN